MAINQHVSSTEWSFEAFVGFGVPSIVEVAILTAGNDPLDADYFTGTLVDDVSDPLWPMAVDAFFGVSDFGLGKSTPDYFVALLVSGDDNPFQSNTPALAPNDYQVWYRLTIGNTRPVILAGETLTIFQEGGP